MGILLLGDEGGREGGKEAWRDPAAEASVRRKQMLKYLFSIPLLPTCRCLGRSVRRAPLIIFKQVLTDWWQPGPMPCRRKMQGHFQVKCT